MDTQGELIRQAEYMVKLHPNWLWSEIMQELITELRRVQREADEARSGLHRMLAFEAQRLGLE